MYLPILLLLLLLLLLILLLLLLLLLLLILLLLHTQIRFPYIILLTSTDQYFSISGV